MPEITNSVRVDVDPDAAWSVVGDLAAVDAWVPGVVAARVHGGWRVCTTADGGEIHEEITAYSAAERSYSYIQTQQPLPIERPHGTLSVRPDGDGSVIVWDAAFGSDSPEVTRMIGDAYRETIASLARLIER
jgi:uncharacterized protein YndB with AHSA1/START domain